MVCASSVLPMPPRPAMSAAGLQIEGVASGRYVLFVQGFTSAHGGTYRGTLTVRQAGTP